ncbi:MAG: argininosuccinate lyase, partial [Lentisphaerae bacterium]|nr:argininosuccinate lyase [Lentisphaerota bacterium]
MQQSKDMKTTVGAITPQVLSYTAGEDVDLDRQLIDADCIGTAAHVTMLAAMPLKPPLFSKVQRDRIIDGLVRIMQDARRERFQITLKDQDVHLAVERVLTARLGDLGRKVHTGRSRNDQVAVDLRLFAKEQMLATTAELGVLADALLKFGYRHRVVPMVGRTHMQPAMPSSVGLWASAYAEGLLEDQVMLQAAYEINDRCPLGSAAGYGVPLPIDRRLTSDLLGFRRPYHNVICAANGRGKLETATLMALSQIMTTLSRLAQDLMIFTMPEFGYFKLPSSMCTGSSIMPQKNNPDILELLRARAARLTADAMVVAEITRALPAGYNRDLQETKAPFMRGFLLARSALQVMTPLLNGLRVDQEALLRGFSPAVFATDRALALARQGMPFREA